MRITHQTNPGGVSTSIFHRVLSIKDLIRSPCCKDSKQESRLYVVGYFFSWVAASYYWQQLKCSIRKLSLSLPESQSLPPLRLRPNSKYCGFKLLPLSSFSNIDTHSMADLHFECGLFCLTTNKVGLQVSRTPGLWNERNRNKSGSTCTMQSDNRTCFGDLIKAPL